MTRSADAPYPVIEIQPDWVMEGEVMGSKPKFWFRSSDGESDWLFKYPQPNAGQHWSEKIAAEVAGALGIPHARVELAVFRNERGSATESFARNGRGLYHGNQVLAGRLLDYDPEKRFRQSDHTLENIFAALDLLFASPDGRRRAKRRLAECLVLDALIGNTDRHHENWGILRRRTGDRWAGTVAPTFDHASSLGRELLDEGAGKSRRRLLAEQQIPRYAERAPGAIYWQPSDKRGISPLELVRRAGTRYEAVFRRALSRVDKLNECALRRIVKRIPEGWMSALSRTFAVELMCYNLNQMRRIAP